MCGLILTSSLTYTMFDGTQPCTTVYLEVHKFSDTLNLVILYIDEISIQNLMILRIHKLIKSINYSLMCIKFNKKSLNLIHC